MGTQPTLFGSRDLIKARLLGIGSGMTETETKNPGEKTLKVTSSKTLTLKRTGIEQGVVRQSFSHGRSKPVVVEKVKRRVIGPGEGKAEPAAAPAAPPAPAGRGAKSAPAAAPAALAPKPSGV